ncbi:hypothetical protein ACWDFH_07270 [Streptomyces kronopolitis]
MSDVWNGKLLADAVPIKLTVHYRVHAVDDGELLGCGSGDLATAVHHYNAIKAQNLERHIVIRPYDGPAHHVQ